MDLTDLYRGPLEEFVARRTNLARELRATDPAAAEAIRKIRKPPVSVWAIDQLSVDHEQPILELLAAAADARDAQRAVAGQSETRDRLLVASNRLRDAVEAAARRADDVLEQAGHARGEETGRRIRASLQSAATGSAAERLAVWRGTLDHEVASSGFGGIDIAEDDTPELAKALAPLRRVSPQTRDRAPLVRTPSTDDHSRREAMEREVKKQDAAAERARDLATSKRTHAERLSDEARIADREAHAAEQAAEEAEAVARAAHAARGDSTRTT